MRGNAAIRLSEHFTVPRLLRFTFPTVIMLVLTMVYGVADGLFVSNLVGKTSFAAVNFFWLGLFYRAQRWSGFRRHLLPAYLRVPLFYGDCASCNLGTGWGMGVRCICRGAGSNHNRPVPDWESEKVPLLKVRKAKAGGRQAPALLLRITL